MAKFIVESVQDNLVTLRTGNTNYANTFKLADGKSLPAPGERVVGSIQAQAWKVDTVAVGGNYVEPLVGRPRRMQGTVLAVQSAANQLTVQVGYEVTVQLTERCCASHFQIGSRVAWDNLELPVFIPQA